MKLVGIPSGSDRIKELLPFFEKIAGRSHGRWTVPGLWTAVEDRDMQAWAAVDDDGRICALALTEVFQTHRNEKWARVLAGTGEDRESWQGLMFDLAEKSKEAGFDGLEVVARPGWARVFKDKFKETHRVLEMRF